MMLWTARPGRKSGEGISSFFCRFEDSAQELAFQNSVWRTDARQMRIVLGMGVVAVLASLTLEYFRIGQGEAFFWSALARAFFLVVCNVALFASTRGKPSGLMAWSLVAASAALALVGVVTILVGGLPWQDYAATTALTMIYLSIFVPNRPVQAMLSAIILAISYVGLLPFLDVSGNVARLLIVEGAVLLICLAAIRVNARSRRHAFLQGINLSVARESSRVELSESEFQRQTFEAAAVEGVSVMEELAITREDAERQSTFLTAVLDNISRGVCVFDKDLKLAVWNQRLVNMKIMPGKLLKVGTPLSDIFLYNAEQGEYGEGDPKEIAAGRMKEIQREEEIHPFRYERTRPCGMVVDVCGNPMPGGGSVTTYTDITERKKSEEVIRKMALRDPLTGVSNRNAFNQKLQAAMAGVGNDGDEFALALFDLDDFKPVNDLYGHPVGDALLCHVASIMEGSVRDDDVVARMGGDEFAVILNHIRGRSMAEELVRRIVDKLSKPVTLDGHEISIGASAGISIFPSDATEAEEIIRRADRALYAAKASGKNQLKLAASNS